MPDSALPPGTQLTSISTLVAPNGSAAEWSVGRLGVTEIVVSQCDGPMGKYDVAVVRREGQPDFICPIHMLEIVTVKEADDD